MNKEVLITIKGLQFGSTSEGEEPVETINRGQYFDKGEKRYIAYDETPDGSTTVKSIIKFTENSLELTRKGAFGTHLLFEEGKKNITDYSTPFGNLVVGMDTQSINYDETEDTISIDISYNMEINYEHVAECKLNIKIESI